MDAKSTIWSHIEIKHQLHQRWASVISLLLLPMAALARGYAHGSEVAADTTRAGFLAGMCVATALLRAVGIAMALVHYRPVTARQSQQSSERR
jgi:hydrogenase/urease accessory protein HupE